MEDEPIRISVVLYDSDRENKTVCLTPTFLWLVSEPIKNSSIVIGCSVRLVLSWHFNTNYNPCELLTGALDLILKGRPKFRNSDAFVLRRTSLWNVGVSNVIAHYVLEAVGYNSAHQCCEWWFKMLKWNLESMFEYSPCSNILPDTV